MVICEKIFVNFIENGVIIDTNPYQLVCLYMVSFMETALGIFLNLCGLLKVEKWQSYIMS